MAKPKTVPLEWARSSDIVALFVVTGVIAEEEPQSLLVYGDPAVGKSVLLERFKYVVWLTEVFDLTMGGMYDKLFPTMRDSKQTHVVMTELHKMYERQKSTADNAINTLSSAMSGNLSNSYVGPNHWSGFEGFRIGVIGAMTTKTYGIWVSKMKDTGLLSRFCCYHMSPSTEMLREQRRAANYKDAYMISPYQFNKLDITDNSKREVGMSKLMLQQSDALSETVPVGHITARSTNMVRTLIKSAAILRGGRHVEKRDVESVRSILNHIYTTVGARHGKG